MDTKSIAENIVNRIVHRASNGNGLRMTDLHGNEIAWCAGALTGDDSGAMNRTQMIDLFAAILTEHEGRIFKSLMEDAETDAAQAEDAIARATSRRDDARMRLASAMRFAELIKR